MGTHNAPLNKRDLMFIFWECMFLASLSKDPFTQPYNWGETPQWNGLDCCGHQPEYSFLKVVFIKLLAGGGTHRAHVSINRGSNVDTKGQKN